MHKNLFCLWTWSTSRWLGAYKFKHIFVFIFIVTIVRSILIYPVPRASDQSTKCVERSSTPCSIAYLSAWWKECRHPHLGIHQPGYFSSYGNFQVSHSKLRVSELWFPHRSHLWHKHVGSQTKRRNWSMDQERCDQHHFHCSSSCHHVSAMKSMRLKLGTQIINCLIDNRKQWL